MTTFWLIAISLLLVILGFVLLALNKSKKAISDTNGGIDKARGDINTTLARERLQEMKLELASGSINDEEYAELVSELELTLADDLDSTLEARSVSEMQAGKDIDEDQEGLREINELQHFKQKLIIASCLCLLLILSIPIYFYLGTPRAVSWAADDGTGNNINQAAKPEQSLPVLVELLEQRMVEQPENAQGWFLLGRSYMTLQRFDEAVVALEKAHQMIGDEPFVLIALADAISMSRGGKVSGRPFELVNRALAAEPDNINALWLQGAAYTEKHKHVQALQSWQKAEAVLLNDQDYPGREQALPQIRQLIAEARSKIAGADVGETGTSTPSITTASGSGSALHDDSNTLVSIRVRVEIAQELKSSFDASDTVLVYALAKDGPGMPLAIIERSAADLPLEVVLDDSMAMMPGMTISRFAPVRVVARIGKKATAVMQSGDLFGKRENVEIGRDKEKVLVVINTVAP